MGYRDDLCAQTFCHDPHPALSGRYGSATLIGPDLLLTAAHNLTNAAEHMRNRQVPLRPLASEALVELQIDKECTHARHPHGPFDPPAERGTSWSRAELAWPDADDKLRHDVAILRLRSGTTAHATAAEIWRRISPRPYLGRLERAYQAIRVYGYPWFGSEAGDSYMLRLFDGEPDERVEERQDPMLSLERGWPSEAQGWSGVSGAAVWFENAVIGIVTRAATRTHGNDQLFYKPLADLYRERRFFVAAGMDLREAVGLDLCDEMRKLDRDDEVDAFFQCVGKHYYGETSGRAEPDLPTIVIVPGHERDALETCVLRYAQDVLVDCFRDVHDAGRIEGHFRSPILAGVQKTGIDVDERVRRMLRDWVDRLDTRLTVAERNDAEKLEAKIRDWAGEADTSRILVVGHDEGDLGEGCVSVLQRLICLLFSLKPMSPPLFVLVRVLTGSASTPRPYPEHKELFEGKRDRFDQLCLPILRQAVADILAEKLLDADPDEIARQADRRFVVLPDPGDCQANHTQNWIDDVAKGFGHRPVAGRLLSDLTARPWPIRTAHEMLYELDWEGTS